VVRSRTDRRRPAVLDDRQWLEREYVDKKRSTADIGVELGVQAPTVQAALHRRDVTVRPGRARRNPLWDRELLQRLYVTERKSLRQIAREVGCAPSLVAHMLQVHGVEGRSLVDAQRKRRQDERNARQAEAEKLRDWLIEERAQMNGAAPPEVLRALLEAARTRGLAFWTAWPIAREVALEGVMFERLWREALTGAGVERQWRLSYLRVGPRLTAFIR
jgi:hypothetical protein